VLNYKTTGDHRPLLSDRKDETMATLQRLDPTYVLGDSPHERRRLQEQSNLINPFTRQLLENAGITAGMRVLDIGSGAGDVALLLADRVGPTGAVVGIDRNPAILETARERVAELEIQNVRFVAGDVREIDLPDEFDAVVGRAVLLFNADPAEAIQNALRFLRPGGIVAFQEVDLTTLSVSVPPSPIAEKIGCWIFEAAKRAGIETQMGFQLPRTFMEAGLPWPQLHCDVVIGGGEQWAGYEYAANTVRSLLPNAEKFGVATREEVEIDTLADRFRREIVGQNGVVMLSTWMSAWANKV
jgi:SAM-dependent methyltransferase